MIFRKAGYKLKQINNGFKPYYYLTEDGLVYNINTDKYLKAGNAYKLYTIEGTRHSITLKELYNLVYNKPYVIDNIERLPGEEFRIIPSAPDYLASNLGRFISYKSSVAKLLHPEINSNYDRISLQVDGKRKTFKVHRLVAEAFGLEKKDGQTICHHKDGNSKNNNVDNLCWVSYEEHLEIHTKMKEEKRTADE